MPKATLSATQFSQVYQQGSSVFVFPLKFILLSVPGQGALHCGFAVPKRMIKKAVMRNKLKRRMREAFRKCEGVVRGTITDNQNLQIVVIYSHKQELPFVTIEQAMQQYAQQLSQHHK